MYKANSFYYSRLQKPHTEFDKIATLIFLWRWESHSNSIMSLEYTLIWVGCFKIMSIFITSTQNLNLLTISPKKRIISFIFLTLLWHVKVKVTKPGLKVWCLMMNITVQSCRTCMICKQCPRKGQCSEFCSPEMHLSPKYMSKPWKPFHAWWYLDK